MSASSLRCDTASTRSGLCEPGFRWQAGPSTHGSPVQQRRRCGVILRDAAILRGHVRDDDGRPLPDVEVQVNAADHPTMARRRDHRVCSNRRCGCLLDPAPCRDAAGDRITSKAWARATDWRRSSLRSGLCRELLPLPALYGVGRTQCTHNEVLHAKASVVVPASDGMGSRSAYACDQPRGALWQRERVDVRVHVRRGARRLHGTATRCDTSSG